MGTACVRAMLASAVMEKPQGWRCRTDHQVLGRNTGPAYNPPIEKLGEVPFA
jgi:hypothetical protein